MLNLFSHIIIFPFSDTFSLIALWGKTKIPFKKISSFTWTSSPNTVVPSILAHFPTVDFHPIIELSIQQWDLIKHPFKTTVFFNLTPSSITHPESIVTLGPIIALLETLASGLIKTFPKILGPVAKDLHPFF